MEISPSRSEMKKNKFKKWEKILCIRMYINNVRRPMISLMTPPQCSNQTDVSLMSASDLETNVKSKGKVKKNIIRLPVD